MASSVTVLERCGDHECPNHPSGWVVWWQSCQHRPQRDEILIRHPSGEVEVGRGLPEPIARMVVAAWLGSLSGVSR